MSNFENVKIKLNLSIGYSGANQEDEHYLHEYFDEETWNDFSEKEKQDELHEIAKEWADNFIEYCANLIDRGEHV